MGQNFSRNDPTKARQFFQDKVAFTTGPAELSSALKSGREIRVIDVRAAKDFDREHIPGAVNLPEDQWHLLNRLSLDHLNVIYCYSQVCHLGARAAIEFSSAGFSVMEMDGGFAAWKEYRLPTEGEEVRMADEKGEKDEKDRKFDNFTDARMSHH
jgi:rhodanese-related sulfurtransferase